jgi:hypothetical protein
MAEIILTILLFVGLGGILLIVFRKIPVLASLPGDSPAGEPLAVRLRRQVGSLPGSDVFDYEVHLQKVLSRVRVLTLRTEQKTGTWLEKLRQKSNQKKNGKDNYWEELKKAKDGR